MTLQEDVPGPVSRGGLLRLPVQAGPPRGPRPSRTARRERKQRKRSAWGMYGRGPLFVLAVLGFVEAVERRVLPGVIELVRTDLGFSDLQAGLLDSAVIVAALLVAVPAGVLADRLDRRKFIAIAFGGWAVVSGLMGLVRSFGQLFFLRAALGAGDAVNDPAAQSLIADYYPPKVRGRAYGIQRVTPTLGSGVGLALGAALGAAFGWRTALMVMALPGLLVAFLVYRLREPERGASDRVVDDSLAPSAPVDADDATVTAAVTAATTPHSAVAGATLVSLSTKERVRAALRVRSLRALMTATAINSGILGAVAFWGVAYHQRTSGLPLEQAGAVGGLPVLVGALGGALGGGWLVDHLRDRVKGAPLLVAGLMSGLGAIVFTIGFVDGLPLYTVRLPMHALAVGLLVGALPATTAMTAEVVPAQLRGTAFGLLKLSGNVFSALTPPLVGALSDANQFTTSSGEQAGDLGFGFRMTIPLILIGSLLLVRGRRFVDQDVQRAHAGELPPPGPGVSPDTVVRVLLVLVPLVALAGLLVALDLA